MSVSTTAVGSTNIQLGTLCQGLIGQGGARQLNAIYQGTGNYFNPNDGGHTSTATSQKISNFLNSTFVGVSGTSTGSVSVDVRQSTKGYVYVSGTVNGSGGKVGIPPPTGSSDGHVPSAGMYVYGNTNQPVYVKNTGIIRGGGGGGGSAFGTAGGGQLEDHADSQAGGTGLVPAVGAITGYLYNTGSIYGGCGGGGYGFDSQDYTAIGGSGGASFGVGGPVILTDAGFPINGNDANATTGGAGYQQHTYGGGKSGAGGSFTPGPQAGFTGVEQSRSFPTRQTPGGAVGQWNQGFANIVQAGTHN
jgi:hypothetical protein